MTEPYYNVSYGQGFEGFLNYSNLLVEGWMANLFLLFIYLITLYVGNKGDYKTSAISSFAFFICLITSMIMKLFTTINETIIYIIIFGLAGSIIWAALDK